MPQKRRHSQTKRRFDSTLPDFFTRLLEIANTILDNLSQFIASITWPF